MTEADLAFIIGTIVGAIGTIVGAAIVLLGIYIAERLK